MHPGADNFISCGRDNTAHLWNLNAKTAVGKLFLNNPAIPAWDPSGQVFAIACPHSATVLLYDHRNWTKAPFGCFDLLKASGPAQKEACFTGWTTLAFANDGKHLLVGSKYGGHFLLDAFDGSLKAYLRKPEGGTRRVGPGDNDAGLESSGDCCFTPDGRYVISGSRKDLLVWDTLGTPDEKSVLEPAFALEEKREAAVVAYNPRFNMIATADQSLMFWLMHEWTMLSWWNLAWTMDWRPGWSGLLAVCDTL
jgi:COMPASS component SWD2